MFSCDYNGWADVPEEEREGLDAFEASNPEPAIIRGGPHVIRPRVMDSGNRERRHAA
jgi:hypothetical protein